MQSLAKPSAFSCTLLVLPRMSPVGGWRGCLHGALKHLQNFPLPSPTPCSATGSQDSVRETGTKLTATGGADIPSVPSVCHVVPKPFDGPPSYFFCFPVRSWEAETFLMGCNPRVCRVSVRMPRYGHGPPPKKFGRGRHSTGCQGTTVPSRHGNPHKGCLFPFLLRVPAHRPQCIIPSQRC